MWTSYVIKAVFRGCATIPEDVPCHNDAANCNGANICVCDHKLCNDVCNDVTTTTTATTDTFSSSIALASKTNHCNGILMIIAASLRIWMH